VCGGGDWRLFYFVLQRNAAHLSFQVEGRFQNSSKKLK
jgi:hypothetical protein